MKPHEILMYANSQTTWKYYRICKLISAICCQVFCDLLYIIDEAWVKVGHLATMKYTRN